MIGLGPAGPELLTVAALAAIDATPPEHRYLRTRRHPSATAVGPAATSFDAVYESAASIDEVYIRIVDELVRAAGAAAASGDGPVLYAVPGSPAVAERSVELLRQTGVEIEILPGLSFLDLVWERVGVDPVTSGVRVVDGHRFGVEAAGSTGPLLVAQCDSSLVLSEIKLSLPSFDGAPTVTVLQRLGLPDESVTDVAWADMDRPSVVVPDHLTALWIPALAEPVGAELLRFVELIKVLRERCPWDREQTHRSLARHLLEESYETVEAISALGPEGEGAEHLEEELGDVLLQVVLHATIAAEEGWFTLADVAQGIHDKMVSRHPHVFGSATAETAMAVEANWARLKAAEKQGAAGGTEIGSAAKVGSAAAFGSAAALESAAAVGSAAALGSAFDDVSGDLPALLYALGLQKAAAKVGFDWPSADGPLAKVEEELAELRAELAELLPAPGGRRKEEEFGDLLFACVNVGRHVGLDPEVALRGAAARFRARVRAVERRAGAGLATLDVAGLDVLWDEVKGEEG